MAFGGLSLLIWWLIPVQKRVPMLVIVSTQGADSLPPNSLAREDGQLFQRRFPPSYDNVSLDELKKRPRNSAELLALVNEYLSSLRVGYAWQHRAVIIYLSAHGVINRNAEPCFLLPDSHPLDDQTWLPVRELIRQLAGHERLETVNKLLVLDSGKIKHDWSLGLLANGFAAKLEGVISAEAVPNLFVLNSTRGEQQSFAAPELGCTPFGYFFVEGLRGAAAGDDDEITLSELDNYLWQHVGGFARRYRGCDQTPQLIPPLAKDFRLAYATQYRRQDPIPLDRSTLLNNHAAINDLWERAGKMNATGAFRFHPLAWSELTRKLQSLEELIVAGSAYEESLGVTLGDAAALLDEIQQSQKVTGILGSITLAQRFQPVEATSLEEAETHWKAWQEKQEDAAEAVTDETEQSTASSEESTASEEETSEPIGEPSEQPTVGPSPLTYRVAAEWCWRRLNQGPATAEAIDEAFDFLSTASDGPAAGRPQPYSELQLLRIIRQHADWPVVRDQVNRMLAAYSDGNQASAPGDVRAHYWSRPLVEEDDERVRRSLDELISGLPESLDSAGQTWSNLVNYRLASEVNQSVGDAYAVRDRVWAIVPALSEWMLSDTPSSMGPVEQLVELISDTHALGALLEMSPDGQFGSNSRDRVEEISQKAERLSRQLAELLERYESQTGKLATLDSANVSETLLTASQLLRAPLPSEFRSGLRETYLKRVSDGVDPEALDGPTSQPVGEGSVAAFIAGLRRQPVLEILERKHLGNSSFPPIEPPIPLADKENFFTVWKRIASLGGQVRERLAEVRQMNDLLVRQSETQLNAQSPNRRQTRSMLSQADRLVRSHVGLLHTRGITDVGSRLRGLDRSLFMIWQARRTINNAWGPTVVAEAKTQQQGYFNWLGRQQLNTAIGLLNLDGSWLNLVEPESRLIDTYQNSFLHWDPISTKNISADEETYVKDHELRYSAIGEIPPANASVLLMHDRQALPVLPSGNDATPIRRFGIPAQGGNQVIRYRIRNTQELRENGALTAAVYLRGHQRMLPFYFGSQLAGPTVNFETPKPSKSSVVVFGDEKKAELIFVLDCSATMRFRHTSEGNVKRRLDIARAALSKILDELDTRKFNVGLIAYGHRVGWTSGRKVFSGLGGANLESGEDVEVRFPVQPILMPDPSGIQTDRRRAIKAFLQRVRPWGETPLYYALDEALQSSSSTNTIVVAITDGINEVSADTPTSAVRGARNVVDRLRSFPAKIHIIGFAGRPDVAQDVRRWEQKREKWERGKGELAAICSKSGGSFHDIRSPGGLAAALQHAVQAERFSVTKIDGASKEERKPSGRHNP